MAVISEDIIIIVCLEQMTQHCYCIYCFECDLKSLDEWLKDICKRDFSFAYFFNYAMFLHIYNVWYIT